MFSIIDTDRLGRKINYSIILQYHIHTKCTSQAETIKSNQIKFINRGTCNYRSTLLVLQKNVRQHHGSILVHEWIYKVNSADILPRHRTAGPATRGHSLKLEKRDWKIQIHANFFGYRVVDVWNSLPEDVVTASSVNCLKGRLDSLFGNDKYCENGEESEWIYIRNDRNSIQDE